jgi:hypothetical protein
MALAAARNTPEMADVPRVPMSWPVKGATTIYQGSLVVLNAGYAAPGATATGLIAIGRAEETVVNPGADGALQVRVKEGVFPWVNASGDPLLAANLGGLAYITDDQTVNVTATGKSVAGRLVKLETGIAWIRTVLPAGLVTKKELEQPQ